MYRLGVSHVESSVSRDADFDLRNSFLSPGRKNNCRLILEKITAVINDYLITYYILHELIEKRASPGRKNAVRRASSCKK